MLQINPAQLPNKFNQTYCTLIQTNINKYASLTPTFQKQGRIYDLKIYDLKKLTFSPSQIVFTYMYAFDLKISLSYNCVHFTKCI